MDTLEIYFGHVISSPSSLATATLALAATAIVLRILPSVLLAKPLPKALDIDPMPTFSEDTGKDASESTIPCRNPATGESIGRVPIMSAENVRAAVAAARKAQKEWQNVSFEGRRRVMRVLSRTIVAHQATICDASVTDSGKTRIDASLGEILTTLEKLRWVVAEGEKCLRTEFRSTGPMMMHKYARVEYHPLGVIGAIAPWNYPFHNMLNPIIAGLFTGNAVVVKPSEHTSWSSMYFLDICRKALQAEGHSPDLVQVVTGYADTSKALINSGVDKIFFTGSDRVGRHVMRAAADTLTPVVLELGGKDPFVVCDDADFSQVSHFSLRGVFQNCGQNCIGADRLIVQAGIHDKLVEFMKDKVSQMKQANPCDKSKHTDLGAMTMPGEVARIHSLVEDAVNKGAKLVIGGKPDLNAGLFYPPTILTNVTQDMRIAKEEVFGPVAVIFRFRTDEEAINIANSTVFALGSSVFSKDHARAERIAKAIRAGMGNINDFGVNYLCQSLPFGGIGDSGFDRFGGIEGLRGCCVAKAVTVDRIGFIKTQIPAVLQYPTSPKSYDFAESLNTMMYGEGMSTKAKGLFGLLRSLV